MKNLILFLSISIFLFITGCSSTCMEYRSATTAARSEKNLQRAEEWGLKALESPECNPASNAQAPYFLATEVYLIQKKYTEMVKMLNMAKEINSNQPLETPYKLGEQSVETIGEGVDAMREDVWRKIYNKAINYKQKEQLVKAKDKIEIAMLVHPKRIENYSTLAFWHMEDNNMEIAISIINRGLLIDNKNSILNQMKADISARNNKLETARELYLKAIKYSDDPGPIMRKLLFVYIDLGENQKSIDYSNELMDKYPDDPDLYYNVGVLYQRLTLETFDPARDLFLQATVESDPSTISGIYESFKKARQYAYNSKDYFLQASDLELDESKSTKEAVSEMRKIMDQIDELFVPSIRETARSAGVELE